MPGRTVLTTVGGRLPGEPPVPLLPPLDELAPAVVQAADPGAVLVGRGGVQHGDAGSPPACNGAAVSLGAALPSQHPCPGPALPGQHPYPRGWGWLLVIHHSHPCITHSATGVGGTHRGRPSGSPE